MTIVQNPIVRGAFTGALGAALVDVRAWQSWTDAVFNLKLASWRWVQGAIIGAVGGAGLQALLG
jgi:sensor domain CHASE-containing protein